MEPKQFVLLHKSKLLKLLIEEYKYIPSVESALTTVLSLQSDVILPHVVENVTEKLKQSAMVLVTRDEYFTYLTPEGELYDKSVISG